MKINKDLVDAVMMVSFISLVLIGTTNFNSATAKTITMFIVGAIVVLMVILRIIRSRQISKKA